MRLILCMLVVGLLALSGCPKPADKTNVEVSTSGGASDTTIVEAPESADATTPDATEAPPATPGGEETGETAHKPTTKELEGKWFALYGGIGVGARTYTFENGHQLEFLDNGMAIWELAGTGGDQFQVVSKWNMTSGDIILSVDKRGDISKGVEQTPLGFGRDDEVGLTGSQAETPRPVFRFTPEMDGAFLALKGMKGELMVYGRVENANAESVPDVSGDWVLVSAPGQQDDVTVKMVARQMETSWGPYHNTFKGKFSNGYFIGPITSSAGTAYAAVMPKPDGTLDGVISTEPYNKWQATFDFTRAAK
jgi:hypothetical protein